MAEVFEQPIAGCAFVRIPTDMAPFDNPCAAGDSHAVDVEWIVAELLGGNGDRLNLFVPGGLGYDEDLAPRAYDPTWPTAAGRCGIPRCFQPLGLPTPRESGPSGRGRRRGSSAPRDRGRVQAGRDSRVQPPGEIGVGSAAALDLATVYDPYTLLSLVISSVLVTVQQSKAQTLIEWGQPRPIRRAGSHLPGVGWVLPSRRLGLPVESDLLLWAGS